ncbi:hypothetical protein HanHA300_Chr07g0244521 [Helianthus annuus]|nr:hypothetical protein HanHA300_Chr07g0244521 [Helianthus annuus]KAJ0563318.1 hypothetical protein HanHA89_Chr07g0261731 [Helianthus annuus]KAJ0728661.1 hypothetical protein HanLR1_Chr07g0244171 [Helianthus annuus]KAJ0731417.1 hypothetical protein HanOQP8_Chr07g0251701 [Helianthus annuus]
MSLLAVVLCWMIGRFGNLLETYFWPLLHKKIVSVTVLGCATTLIPPEANDHCQL